MFCWDLVIGIWDLQNSLTFPYSYYILPSRCCLLQKTPEKEIVMPNIEINGYAHSELQFVRGLAEEIRLLLEKETFADELVLGYVFGHFYDLLGRPKPFLRIWDTDEERGQRIQNILRMNGFEVERPVKLVSFVEPPFWSEAEIMEDLQWILESDWLKSYIPDGAVSRAIEDLRSHEYAKVADFYVHVARELQALICRAGVLSFRSEIVAWVASTSDKKIVRNDTHRQSRLVMLIQIIFSLMPDWNILTIFPSD